MKNICIIANFEKTYLFSEIVKKLDLNKVFWIVVNQKQKNFLYKKFKISNILYLPKKNEKSSNFSKLDDEIKINEIIYSDRSLNNSSSVNSDYLVQSKRKIENFIKRKKISFVFGELTWAIEILTFQICKKINSQKVLYLNPASIRLPQDRFIFFTDIHQSEFIKRNYKFKAKQINFNSEQKNYFHYIKKIGQKRNFLFYSKKFFNLIFDDYYDKWDPTKITKIKRIKKFFSKIVNTISFKTLSKVNLNYLNKKKFVIFFLQKKPEQSLDVKGMYYNDNYKNIENIWKILPHNFILIIKEHPSNIGNSNRNFYKKILNKRNIHLIRNDIKFNDLVLKSFATFSVNSTASLNSACLKVPSFTFSKCYFNELKFSMKISLEDLIQNNLYSLIKKLNNDNKLKNNLLNSSFLSNSFKGNLFGEKTHDINNIKNLKKSIEEISK